MENMEALNVTTRDQIITVKEACELLRLGKSKVYELLEEGTLEGVHLGRTWRTTVKACDDFLEEQSRLSRLTPR